VKKAVLSILFFFITVAAFSQVNDRQLASFYFQQGEYEKAVLYYEKLYTETPQYTYYDFFRRSLYALERYKDVKELIKRQQRIFSNEKVYDIDLADYYDRTGDSKKAEKILDKLIDDLRANYSEINQLADEFSSRGEIAYALKVYQKGRKILPAYPFNMEIARLQGELGNTEEMISEYLDLLEINPAYLQSVQNSLNRSLGFEQGTKENMLLKADLYKRIQRNPGKSYYNELLIWILTQEKDFEGVYRQSVSLDKRQSENGFRLLDLSFVARNNVDYDLAIKSLDYVISKGKDSPLFIDAKVNLLQVLYEKVKSSNNYELVDLQRLEAEYEATLEELGRNARTVSVIRELAEIQGVYQKRYEDARSTLERALKLPGISKTDDGELKLLLADIELLDSNPWDASLLYMQVEKAFKYDRLGEIAKFRNSRIYYYEGEFELAKAMLDVLKGSTSKKIANDAMDLSLLITDNSTIDTSTTALKIFAKADLLYTQDLLDDSEQYLDSLQKTFPGHALSDEILFMRSKISAQLNDFDAQEKYLLEIVRMYSADIIGDDAVFALAQLYEFQKDEPEKAAEYYKSILTDYKDSLFVIEARKRYRALRGDQIN
jgi:tetratricopeptide (TPR) repeat protein